MVDVQQQYEAYPYPERDPKDEAKRLITGSPSHPLEIDHFCFGGQRDWSKPLRALVAGGGTGDALIQLAQVLNSAGRPYDITYIDLSTASRQVAEARAKARGLTGITFHTGSLLDAPDYGTFDYIDCCGVLHHLPDPAQGFAALRAAVAPDGAMGLMVYAPYGRSGVYPLQAAFGTLFEGLTPQDRLSRAQKIVADLPQGHPFRANVNLSDHNTSDAGFYDLLLHSQDRAYDVPQLLEVLRATDWHLSSFATPALYDLSRITQAPTDMGPEASMAVAEQLRGTLRLHVAYVLPKAQPRLARGAKPGLIPHLKGVQASALARAVGQGRPIPVTAEGIKTTLTLPKAAALLIAVVNGRRSLGVLAKAAKLDPLAFNAIWAPVERDLCDWGLMLYSSLLDR